MQELTWLDTHIGSTERSTELINQFHWNISCTKSGQQWLVKAGEKVILRTDSRESLDSFLYGMALAYSIVPENLKTQFISQFDFD